MSLPNNAKRVFKGEIFDVYQWDQELYDGTHKIFERIKRPNGAAVIATSTDGKIYITHEEQPHISPFLSLIRGGCEPGEEPLQTAKRELLEEAGMTSTDWELFGSYKHPNKIHSTSYIYIARNCEIIQDQNLDAGEKIKVIKLGWQEFLDAIVKDEFRVKEFTLAVLKELYLDREVELRDRIFGENS